MMFGLILAFWSTPRMTAGHIIFTITMTAYIFIGVKLEERDLIRSFGEKYKGYQRRVTMLIPLLKK
jgi:protein-S-isoprenylcysteine O-methyltransferase Ste14